MTVADGTLVVFTLFDGLRFLAYVPQIAKSLLLMVCAFRLTADRRFTGDLGQDGRHRADAAVPDRARARDDGGREFWPEVDGKCGSNRSA
jgi:hypothetical protein